MIIYEEPEQKPAFEPIKITFVFETAKEFMNVYKMFNVCNDEIAPVINKVNDEPLEGSWESQFDSIHSFLFKVMEQRDL